LYVLTALYFLHKFAIECFFDYSVCFIKVTDCSIRVSWSLGSKITVFKVLSNCLSVFYTLTEVSHSNFKLSFHMFHNVFIGLRHDSCPVPCKKTEYPDLDRNFFKAHHSYRLLPVGCRSAKQEYEDLGPFKKKYKTTSLVYSVSLPNFFWRVEGRFWHAFYQSILIFFLADPYYESLSSRVHNIIGSPIIIMNSCYRGSWYVICWYPSLHT